MARTQPLPEHDDVSDEDSLSRLFSDDPELLALLRPGPPAVVRAQPGKPVGLGARRVSCAVSVSSAVVEDRR